jgi:multimeric flavodoxin WrbA
VDEWEQFFQKYDLLVCPMSYGPAYKRCKQGTPIYYDHVSARTKLFIDRLHFYSMTHGQEYHQKFQRNVKFISIVTFEWDKPDAYDAVIHWINERMNQYWKMQLVASLKAEGTHKTPVSERYMLLQNAKELGRTL